MLLLSQSSTSAMGDIFIAIAVIATLIVAGAVTVMYVRKRMAYDAPAGGTESGSMLSALRKLRDTGEISPEEFEKAKEKLVSKAQKELSELPQVLPANRRGAAKGPGLKVEDKGPPPDKAIPEKSE
jgi:uncharacterized membrane protein